MAHDPLFFDRVDQFALEVHLSEMWALNNAHFLNYGRLLALLIRSGFLLQHVYLDFCSGGEEDGSMVPLARSSGYVRRTHRPTFHCENLLFARSRTSRGRGIERRNDASSPLGKQREAGRGEPRLSEMTGHEIAIAV